MPKNPKIPNKTTLGLLLKYGVCQETPTPEELKGRRFAQLSITAFLNEEGSCGDMQVSFRGTPQDLCNIVDMASNEATEESENLKNILTIVINSQSKINK